MGAGLGSASCPARWGWGRVPATPGGAGAGACGAGSARWGRGVLRRGFRLVGLGRVLRRGFRPVGLGSALCVPSVGVAV
ncbi:hypothetical protein GCM10009536_47610 [Streptomyces thermocarboxydus]